jgi:hypothetical protein
MGRRACDLEVAEVPGELVGRSGMIGSVRHIGE